MASIYTIDKNERIVVLRKMPGGGSAKELKKKVENLTDVSVSLSGQVGTDLGSQRAQAKALAYLVSAVKEQQEAIATLRRETTLLG